MRKNVVEKKKNEEIDQKNVKLKMWLNYFILLFFFSCCGQNNVGCSTLRLIYLQI